MGIFTKTSLGILTLSSIILICSCASIYNVSTPQKFSPEWWDSLKRPEDIPNIRGIIYNDYQLGWLYNQGERFSNSAFKEFVYGLEISKGCKDIIFWYGITLNRERVIRGAVIFN
jgi:hypothetical protein